MQVAIVHDYIKEYGGAERVLEAMHEIWPEAPVYTSIYDQELMRRFGFNSTGWEIRTSFMQHLPLRGILPRFYLTFLYPLAFRLFDLSRYDMTVSSSSYAAKNITKPKGSVHFCYCHTPPRFLWGYDQETTMSAMRIWEKLAAKIFTPILRKMDLAAAGAVDFFIANSAVVQERIKKNYRKDSVVIYPPVDTERFEKPAPGPFDEVQKPYFLVISRLGDYKRVDIVVEAFNNLGINLKVIGTGPKLAYLKSLGKRNIEFLGRLNDELTTFYLQHSQGLVFPTEEDFGITPVEANSAGKPVVAYKAGGALETLTPLTAFFFSPQTSGSLEAAIKNFDGSVYNPNTLKKQANKFSKQRFIKEIVGYVEDKVERKK